MNVERTERGFEVVTWTDKGGRKCELQQSSAMDGGWSDAIDRPGQSFVWFGLAVDEAGYGMRMHLDRDQVRELINRLDAWLKNGTFLFTHEQQRVTG